MMREKILVVFGWLGFFALMIVIISPIVLGFVVGGVVPYDDIPLVIAIAVSVAVPLAAVLYIPVSALITLSMKVFDHDDNLS